MNIEREALACVYGAERFHTYLYGKDFIIESDHQPLEMISQKTLNSAPARLQNMFLRLQKYEYEIRYRPGPKMLLADSFSRMKKSTSDDEIPLDYKVCFIQFSTSKMDELRTTTSQDPVLKQLHKCISDGFPKKMKDLPTAIRSFWSFRDELSIEDGIILKGDQVIIPSQLQGYYLSKIHEGHLGITRCQQRAKSSVFWPGINQDIIDLITKCLSCQKYQKSQPKQPMEPILPGIPSIPWHTLGCDLFSLFSKNYLVIGDYHSKYPFVECINSETSKEITSKTKKILSQFGIPNTFISDNGPCFIGSEFQYLMKDLGIAHITSSPHYPKSHGFIERLVETAKALIKKSPNDIENALLVYRTTPLGSNMPSPAEVLFKRKIQSNLPIHTKGMPEADQFNQKQAERQSKSESYYNKNSHELPELHMEQPIFFQDVAKRSWNPGSIIGIGPEPRSYTIRCHTTGQLLRRNRIMLKPRFVDPQSQLKAQKQTKTSELQLTTCNVPIPAQNRPGAITPRPTIPSRNNPGPANPSRQNSQDPYRTRSGRVSKPPSKLY